MGGTFFNIFFLDMVYMSKIFLIVSMFGLVFLSSCGQNGRFYSDQFLKTSGTAIVNQKGEEVYLYGINIGNWLLVEPWLLKMDGKPGIRSGRDIFDILEKRFGQKKAVELYRTYMDNFINEQDLASIAGTGMNMIRVPFWYGALTDPKYSEREYQYLDRMIGWAKKYRLYVLLDLHGAPGGQNTQAAHLGENKTNQMWTDPELLNRTVNLWKTLAKRYKNEKIVAGYDILNEPSGAPSLPVSMKDLVRFYDVLYKSIREIDTNHMIFIEDGMQGVQRLPHPSVMGWENVVYSFHYYPDPADPKSYSLSMSERLPNLRRAQVYFNVPFHVGEFNSVDSSGGGIRTMRQMFDAFRCFGWSWNIWTYKKIEDNAGFNWGLTGYVDTLTDIDLGSATFEIVRELFSQYNTSYLKKNTQMESAIADFSRALTEAKVINRLRDDLALYPEEGGMTRGKNGGIILEWNNGLPELTKWGDNDTVSWIVNIPLEGDYALLADYSSGIASNAGLKMDVSVDGHQVVEFGVVSSGSRDKYGKSTAAFMKLTNGRHVLSLTAGQTNSGVMNLRSLELVLTNGLPVTNRTDYGSVRLLPLFFYGFNPADSDAGIEWQNTPGNVGHWQSGEKVAWVFESDEDSYYDVSFDFASTNQPNASRFEIFANQDSRGLSVRLPNTGSLKEYRRMEAGRLRFMKGMNVITFQGFTANKAMAGNLGEIGLKKSGKR